MTSQKRRGWVLPAFLLLIVILPSFMATMRLIDTLAPLPTPNILNQTIVPGFALSLHGCFAVGFLLLGALQILPDFRRRHPRWHRSAGKLAWGFGLIGALSGLWVTLAYPTISGPLLYWGRIGASSVWLLSMLMAAWALHRCQWQQHGRWMLRAYALTLPAGTLAIFLLPLVLILGEGHQILEEGVQVLAWPLHLLVLEWLGRRRPPPTTARQEALA